MREELVTVSELLDRYRTATRQSSANSKAGVAEKVGPVTCRPHCSYCCYAKILTPAYMGVFVYLYLRRQGQWTPALREKLVEADREMTIRTHRGWLMGKRPCPFLQEEKFGLGVCMVYAVRPQVCAVTFSVKGDGSQCAVPDQENLVSCVDNRDLMKFLPLVMAVAPFTKQIVTTLPASVLIAEAVFEHLPMPAVASVPFEPGMEAEQTMEEQFDGKFATMKDGE